MRSRGAEGGAPRRLKRWRRWPQALVVLILALMGLLLGGAYVVTRGPVLRALATPRLEAALRLDVRMGDVRLTVGGDLFITDVRAMAADVEGEAATILESTSARIDLGWGRLLRSALGGRAGVGRIELEAPVIRLSSEASGAGFNIDPLLLDQRGAKGAPDAALPEAIVFEDGRLELGEHQGARYQPLQSWAINGRMTRAPSSGRQFEIAIEQRGGDEGARLEGLLDLDDGRLDLALRSLSLTPWREAPLSATTPTWRQLEVEGAVERASLSYARGEAPVGEIIVRDVELRAPVEQAGETLALRMSDVDGSLRMDGAGLRGRASGVVEDLPATVTLETEGLDARAPARVVIRTDRFVVAERPRLLPLAPPDARSAFREFSGPTAIVSGEVTLERGAPAQGKAAPFRTEGTLFIEQATAAQIDFPYPAQQVQGEIAFTETRVDVDLQGRGPTGAELRAEGYVTFGSESDVSIRIFGERVPLDDTLIDSMPEEWRPLVRSFVSEAASHELIDAELMQTPARRAERIERLAALRLELASMLEGSAVQRVELEREIERVERLAQRPIFFPGGSARVQAHVHRQRGGPYQYDIEAFAPRLDLITEEFPYPLRARDVYISVTSGAVTVEASRISGLSGGAGRLEALLGDEVDNEIRVLMSDVPIDGFLLAMLSDDGDDGRSIRDAIAALDVRGRLRSADIEVRPDGDRLRPSAVIEFDGVSASPGGTEEGERLKIRELAGVVRLSEDRVRVGPVKGRIDEAPLWLRVDVSDPAAEGSGGVAGRLEITGLDVSLPIEEALRAGAPGIAERIASFRAERAPKGRVTLDVEFAGLGDEDLEATSRLREPKDLTFSVDGGRIGLVSAGGVIEVGPNGVAFEDVAGIGIVDGLEIKSVRLDGRADLAEQGAVAMEAKFTSAPFHAPLIRRLVERATEDEDASPIDWSTLAGVFDAELSASRAAGEEVAVTGAIRPRSAEFRAGEHRIRFGRIGGVVRFDDDGGRIEDLRMATSEWETTVSGAWAARPSLHGELELRARGERMPRDLVALLPADVQEAFADLELHVSGGFELKRATLGFREAETEDAAPAIRFRGDVAFEGVSFGSAVPVSDLSGRARIVAEPAPESERPILNVELSEASGTAAGIRFSRGAARLQSESGGARLAAPSFTADVHGGRMVGRAIFEEMTLDGEVETGFEVDIRLAGVDLERFASDTTGDDVAEDGQDSGPRGRVESRLSLSGMVGRPELSRGRGSLHVSGGDLVEFPLLMRVLELSALQAPRAEPVDRADASFFILGERLYFETLNVRSRSILVTGSGAATWPELDLDLRFRTSGAFRVPVISGIADAVRNELATIVVRGPVDDPQFSTVQLPGTRRVLQGVVGQRVEGGGVGRPGRSVGSEPPPRLKPVRPAREGG